MTNTELSAALDAAVGTYSPPLPAETTQHYIERLREENQELLDEIAQVRQENERLHADMQAFRDGVMPDDLWAVMRQCLGRIRTAEQRVQRGEYSHKTLTTAWDAARARIGAHLKGKT